MKPPLSIGSSTVGMSHRRFPPVQLRVRQGCRQGDRSPFSTPTHCRILCRFCNGRRWVGSSLYGICGSSFVFTYGVLYACSAGGPSNGQQQPLSTMHRTIRFDTACKSCCCPTITKDDRKYNKEANIPEKKQYKINSVPNLIQNKMLQLVDH